MFGRWTPSNPFKGREFGSIPEAITSLTGKILEEKETEIGRDIAKSGHESKSKHKTGVHSHKSTHASKAERNSKRSRTTTMSTNKSGPECKNLVNLHKSIETIPSNLKAHFESISKHTLDKVIDANALTVWETDADLDGLLHLTQVFFKIKAANASPSVETGAWGSENSGGKKAMGMVIISQEKNERDGFTRLVDLFRHLTETQGENHLTGTACAFGSIVVVRGYNYSSKRRKDGSQEACKRINITIEHVLKMLRSCSSSGKRKIIWHHGPKVSFLLKWINTTTPELRSSLSAITITAAVSFNHGLKPSPHGGRNTPEDMATLEEYANRLGVPVLLLDPVTQLISNEYLSHYICYFGYYITLFLPASITRPHYEKALDQLTTFAFRLWGATKGVYGNDVVNQVKEHLEHSRAQLWAKKSISPKSYTKKACRSAGDEISLQHAASLADSPWAMFKTEPYCPLPYLTRLPLLPTTSSSSTTPETGINTTHRAIPLYLSPRTSTFKISPTSPFFLLVPHSPTSISKATARIQGIFTGILTRVLEIKKQRPGISPREVHDWGDCLGAMNWAFGECMAGLPEQVRTRAEVVGRMLVVQGVWGYLVKNQDGNKGMGTNKDRNMIRGADEANKGAGAWGSG